MANITASDVRACLAGEIPNDVVTTYANKSQVSGEIVFFYKGAIVQIQQTNGDRSYHKLKYVRLKAKQHSA